MSAGAGQWQNRPHDVVRCDDPGGHMRRFVSLLVAACCMAACTGEAPPDTGETAASAGEAAPAAAAAPAAPAGRPPPGVSVNGKPLAPLVVAADQHALLESDDPKLARNKKHVYDFW